MAHGGGHSHVRGRHLDPEPERVRVGRTARSVLLGTLALLAVATVVGLFAFWPDPAAAPGHVDHVADGASSLTAEVESVGEPCPVIVSDSLDPTGESPSEPPAGCDTLDATVGAGESVSIRVPPYVARSGLAAGDTVRLLRIPATEGQPATYGYLGVVRELPLGLLAVAFAVLVGLIARLRGILALVGLVFAAVVLARFMLPALLAGESGPGVALVGSAAIMFVVLYLAHGPSLRTSAALAGTLAGIAVTALLGAWSVGAARLSGISDDTGEMLGSFAPQLDHQGLLTCAVIVAGLGVLNDVTITQASAVWELRAAAPTLSRAGVFVSAMRIGRDHIASTIYTIVFAYAGTGLAVLMLLSLYDRPMLELLSDESISVEIVRTLTSGIGLVLAVPLTTAIAALVVAGPTRGAGTEP